MSIKEFRLDRKSAGANQLEGLWGPLKGDLLYDMSAKNGGKGNHATREGTEPGWAFDPHHGQVPYFDGVNDAFDAERSLSIHTDAFTVTAWVWLDSTIATHSPVIMGQGVEPGATEWTFWVSNPLIATERLRFNAIGIWAEAPNGSFPLDEWVHVAAARFKVGGGGASLSIYQNGLLMHTDALADNNIGTAKVFRIGAGEAAAQRRWKGMIDDVRYYSRCLSIAQITHIYRMTRYNPYADLLLRPTRRIVHRHRGALEAD
jgi:hypothetical protein